MEKPIIHLHIGTLIGKVEIVNVLFDPKKDLTEQSQSQLNNLRSVVESSLSEILKRPDIGTEIYNKGSFDDTEKKGDH